jgi:sulfur carrier protein ThiS
LIAASLGTREKWIEITEHTRIQDVLALCAIPVDLRWTVTSVNGVVKSKNTVLKEGDELFIFPVGGGG